MVDVKKNRNLINQGCKLWNKSSKDSITLDWVWPKKKFEKQTQNETPRDKRNWYNKREVKRPREQI